MITVRACPLPEGSLLSDVARSGAYVDCFVAEVAAAVALERFVAAFYTTRLFKLERWILGWAIGRPSTDMQAAELASGRIDTFAAWRVEQRRDDELLLRAVDGRTRSWLRVEPIDPSGAAGTRLYFGSAVDPVPDRKTGKPTLGPAFRWLLGLHRLYSVLLLRAAAARLLAQRP